MRDHLPSEVICSMETRQAIMECCTEFVHLISSEGSKKKKKTCETIWILKCLVKRMRYLRRITRRQSLRIISMRRWRHLDSRITSRKFALSLKSTRLPLKRGRRELLAWRTLACRMRSYWLYRNSSSPKLGLKWTILLLLMLQLNNNNKNPFS